MVEMGAEKEKQVPITSKEAEGGILRVEIEVWSWWACIGIFSDRLDGDAL